LLRIVWEDSSTGLVITDERGVFLHANAAYCAMLGYTAEELIGQSFLMISPPEYRDMYAVMFERVTSSQRTGSSGEFEVRRKDGRLVTLLTHDSLLQTPEGIRHFFVNHDVTEQKALEQHRLHVNRMSTLGTLAGGVAHEFNNLLVSILGYAELIQAKPELRLETLLEFASKIQRAARRGRELTAQLLPFARPEARRKQTVDLHHIIEEAAELFRLSSAAVPVRLALEADSAVLAGDAIQLQQVFLNLFFCASAARAEPGQPVSLTTQRVQESMRPGGETPVAPYEFLLIEVSPAPVRHGTADAGEQQALVTPDPFDERSGLSMALVYGSITSHGGWMASAGGKLRIWLPALSRRLP
jgi:PAS domain S-box-containing protein